MARFAAPLQQFLDTNCNRLANGSIAWFENGTTTPKEVFQDPEFTISQSNPTSLDSCGQTPELLQLDGVYTAEVRDSTDAVIDTINDVTGVGGSTTSGTTAADVLYTAPFTGAVQQTTKNRLGKRVYISDFAITPQPTGQRLEIQTVIDTLAALNAEYTIVFGDPGEYNIDLTTTDTSAAGAAVGLIMPSNIHLELIRGSNLRVLANNSDSYALILYPSTTTNSFVFGGGQLIGDISDHTTGTGDDGNLLWFAGCTNCGAINIEANEAWGNSAYISEDDATNDRASEIILENFVNRSNRNNGILIDNSDTVDIINYKAFSIGQGASQSGTSSGISMLITADTTRIGNINISNPIIDGCFGNGIDADFSSSVALTDYGVNNIIISSPTVYNASIGVKLSSPIQGLADSLMAGGIVLSDLVTENTQLAGLEANEFSFPNATSKDFILTAYNLTIRNPWLSSLGDVLSAYINCDKSNPANFANMVFTNINATDDNSVSGNRPTYLARLNGSTGITVKFVNIIKFDNNSTAPDGIFPVTGGFITVLDYNDQTSSNSIISRDSTDVVSVEGDR